MVDLVTIVPPDFSLSLRTHLNDTYNDTNKEEQLDDYVERYLYKVDDCV